MCIQEVVLIATDAPEEHNEYYKCQDWHETSQGL